MGEQKRKRLPTRLPTRLEQLRKLVGWVDISDEEYLREKEAVDRELMLIPDNDKLVLFDRQREVVVTMSENLRRATPERRREFVLLLMERAVAYDREVREVAGSPGAAILRRSRGAA